MKNWLIKIFIIIIILASYYPVSLNAQDRKANIELPTTFIIGEASIRVRGGIKQNPNKPPVLTADELDSLNSLQKQPSFLLPPKKLPDKILSDEFSAGFLKGGFGQFVTPFVEAGYGFRAGDENEYDLYFNGGFEASGGHDDDAEYDKAFGKIALDYFAPDKFWIFGGSRTHTEFYANRMNYNLYSLSNAATDSTPVPKSSALNAALTIDSDGMYEGYKFRVGGAFKSLQLERDTKEAFDNAISAYLNIRGIAGDFEVGGNAVLDFHSIHGRGVRYTQANAMLYYFIDKLTFKAEAGFQMAQNYNGIDRNGLLLSADAEFRLNGLLTFKGGAYSGIKPVNYKDAFLLNPYISTNAGIDFNSLKKFDLFAHIHPGEALSLIAGGSYAINDRNPYFAGNNSGEFNLAYDNTTALELMLEADWQPGENDNLIFNITMDKTTIDSSDKELPYSVPLKASICYRKSFVDMISAKMGVVYVGDRFADAANLIKLESFVNLNAEIDFKLTKTITLFGRFDNLMNNNVIVWDGYKERGLFLTGGILWRF